jgi:hypothetical protein
MSASDLSKLTEADLDALYEVVHAPNSPFAVGRLAHRLPRDRFSFALLALEGSGLLEIRIEGDEMVLRAPFSSDNRPVRVARAGRSDGRSAGEKAWNRAANSG